MSMPVGMKTDTVWFSGLHHQLRDGVAESLEDAGFRVPTTGHREPYRVCRRLFGLSHAAMAGSSSMA